MALPFLSLPPVSGGACQQGFFLNCISLAILHFDDLVLSADLPLFPSMQLCTHSFPAARQLRESAFVQSVTPSVE